MSVKDFFKERVIVVDGKMHTIQDWGYNSFIGWIVVLSLVLFVWAKLFIAFHMPSEDDFNSDQYRKEAYVVANELMVENEKKRWQEKGFIEKTPAPRSVAIKYDDRTSYRDIAELTKYYSNGKYQIYVVTEANLSASSEDGKRTYYNIGICQRDYIVTIHSTPKRNWYGTVHLNWKISHIKLVSARPDENQVNKIMQNWKVPPRMTANW